MKLAEHFFHLYYYTFIFAYRCALNIKIMFSLFWQQKDKHKSIYILSFVTGTEFDCQSKLRVPFYLPGMTLAIKSKSCLLTSLVFPCYKGIIFPRIL